MSGATDQIRAMTLAERIIDLLDREADASEGEIVAYACLWVAAMCHLQTLGLNEGEVGITRTEDLVRDAVATWPKRRTS